MPLNAVLILVLLIGTPLVMMVQLWRQHQLTVELEEKGVHAWAEVVGTRTSWLNAKYRIVEYVFPLPDGSLVHGEFKQSRGGFWSRGTVEGEQIELHYLPDNPHRHQRVGTEVGLLAVLSLGFGTVVFMSLAIIVMMNAPSKKAPAPHGSTPSSRLRTYDEPPPRGKGRVTGPLNRNEDY
ncbi:hypothetical protein COCOR_07760 [Corallococcus coralloides DSM 2259]|uniref:DUF3592 domain-containing protein n=1 Tax=Corallococcus coralloides (strain ATCC 25202 / DSM 2259 / NBRC 100086 / M2) TaxID=1144275 RepID=H8MTB3_CORCM|nr:DUF3592 domain-containing protein [Corallococcus coralloides]AFE07726.1 hypothetical protein COCOR_07760 [Corallococcus coralloides DSM 2259]